MNRNAIIQHIDLWKAKLGSYSEVARRCKISPAALSTLIAGKYGADEAKILQQIATSLGYKEDSWVMVRSIRNYRVVETLIKDAKDESMWFVVSNRAGSGKTAALEDVFNNDLSGSVIFIQAEEWSARQFLLKLVAKTQGESALKGKYLSIAALIDMVANYFNEMSLTKPVLLIDEADKLKPAAKRVLIPLYNRTEGRLGAVVSGTENLQKEMTGGVRLKKQGYDELDSRFGRTYITLPGISAAECLAICKANGIGDEETATEIWFNLPKEDRMVTVRTEGGRKEKKVPHADDLRLLKRLIKRELLKTKTMHA